MNKIQHNAIDMRFATLRQQNEKALIAYLAAGDPDLATTEQLVLQIAEAGADLIEIGVPFSDPVAEGPIIASASERALRNKNVNLPNIFAMTSRLSAQTDIPLLLMLYANSIFRYGAEAFFAHCRNNFISGVIVPDVPFEEQEAWKPLARAQGVHLISMVAPTSQERIETIAKDSSGFLYCVSSLGVTGTRSEFSTDFDAFFQKIRAASDIPTALGFGISSPKQVRALKQYCDGVIVGSAIVRIIGEHGQNSLPYVREFVSSLKEALD